MSNKAILELFGFDFEKDNIHEMSLCRYHIIDRGTPKIFTKTDIKRIMNFKGLIGELKFRCFLRKKLFANYWQVFSLEKIGKDQYIWMWHDDLMGW